MLSSTAPVANTPLILDLIDPTLHAAAYEDYRNHDEGFIYMAGIGNALNVVLDNTSQLKLIDKYEHALIRAFKAGKTNHSHLSTNDIDWLFKNADREVCVRLGDVIADSPITVYRGVAGHGRRRRIAGWSWTTSIQVACWFARRFSLPNPTIFSAVVTRSEVYHYSKERSEYEVIVKPKAPQRMKLSESDMISHANQHQIELENAQWAATAKLWAMASKLATTRNGSK
jgi:hypothetical protein